MKRHRAARRPPPRAVEVSSLRSKQRCDSARERGSPPARGVEAGPGRAAGAAEDRVAALGDVGERRWLALRDPVGDGDYGGSGAPLVVACSGCASSCRNPSTSPWSSSSEIGVNPKVEAREMRGDHRGHHRVERALEDRVDAAGVVDLQSVPALPKHDRKVLTSEAGVGSSPTVASLPPRPPRADRRPGAPRSPRRPPAWSAAIPYAERIWLGKEALSL
jgi:hypothetical protein